MKWKKGNGKVRGGYIRIRILIKDIINASERRFPVHLLCFGREDCLENEQNKRVEEEKNRDRRIEETGQATLNKNDKENTIHLISVIGEIEGHDNLGSNSKTTKYEHILPQLAAIEDSENIDGVLLLLNTVGGDVEAGLAIAEMIASLSKPTVSLVLGGSHSIGVPLAVAADHSFIVKSATMMIHPVRSSGTFIGVIQSYRNIEKIQDRITTFISDHCKMKKERVEELMLHIGQQVKDVGMILSGEEAVKEGLIDEMGGIKEATDRLIEIINQSENK